MLLLHKKKPSNLQDRFVASFPRICVCAVEPFRLRATRRKQSVVEVAGALWQINQSPRALAAILEVLTCTSDVHAKISVIVGLRHFRCQQAEQALQQELSDKALLIRYNAARVLLQLYDVAFDPLRSDHPILMNILSRDSQIWQEAVAQMLALGKYHTLPLCAEINEPKHTWGLLWKR